MQTFSEEQQSRREDSAVTINRLREEHSDVISSIIDKQSKILELQEEIRSLETEKSELLERSLTTHCNHQNEFNETI